MMIDDDRRMNYDDGWLWWCMMMIDLHDDGNDEVRSWRWPLWWWCCSMMVTIMVMIREADDDNDDSWWWW